MEERKIALIPRVVIAGALGPREYGVLLTDRRTIFALESSSATGLGAVLGGAIGAAIAQASRSRRRIDYARVHPEALARAEKSIDIPHEALERLELRAALGGYRLKIDYVRADGKRTKVEAVVAPAPEQVKANRAQGIKPKESLRRYAVQVREAYEKALPPSKAGSAEWRL